MRPLAVGARVYTCQLQAQRICSAQCWHLHLCYTQQAGKDKPSGGRVLPLHEVCGGLWLSFIFCMTLFSLTALSHGGGGGLGRHMKTFFLDFSMGHQLSHKSAACKTPPSAKHEVTQRENQCHVRPIGVKSKGRSQVPIQTTLARQPQGRGGGWWECLQQ